MLLMDFIDCFVEVYIKKNYNTIAGKSLYFHVVLDYIGVLFDIDISILFRYLYSKSENLGELKVQIKS